MKLKALTHCISILFIVSIFKDYTEFVLNEYSIQLSEQWTHKLDSPICSVENLKLRWDDN